MDPILSMILTLAVLGLVAWAIVALVPMPEPYRRVFVGVVVLLALVWILQWAARQAWWMGGGA